MIHVFDRQQRIRNLILGIPAGSAPGDVFIIREINAGVTLSLKKLTGVKQLHIIIHTQDENLACIATGSANAAQQESLAQLSSIIEAVQHCVSQRDGGSHHLYFMPLVL